MAFKNHSYRAIPKKEAPERILSHSELKALNEELKKQVDLLKNRAAKYKEELEELSLQNKELKEKIKLTRYEVDDLKDENVMLRKEIRKLKESA